MGTATKKKSKVSRKKQSGARKSKERAGAKAHRDAQWAARAKSQSETAAERLADALGDPEKTEEVREAVLEQAGDELLAGNATKSAETLEAAGLSPGFQPTAENEIARMQAVRAAHDELAAVEFDMDLAKEEYAELKKKHAAALLKLRRAIREPLQPGLFDNLPEEARPADQVEAAINGASEELPFHEGVPSAETTGNPPAELEELDHETGGGKELDGYGEGPEA